MDNYNDNDIMPFGKHKGQKLQDVPVGYLHWLWQQKPLSDKKLEGYIRDNIDALKMENKDLIWN